jgi:hypothetical protein
MASGRVCSWRGRSLRLCLGVVPVEFPVQLRNVVMPLSAPLRAHPVPMATDCQLGEPHNGDELQDPFSVHRVSLFLMVSDWMSRSSALHVETV